MGCPGFAVSSNSAIRNRSTWASSVFLIIPIFRHSGVPIISVQIRIPQSAFRNRSTWASSVFLIIPIFRHSGVSIISVQIRNPHSAIRNRSTWASSVFLIIPIFRHSGVSIISVRIRNPQSAIVLLGPPSLLDVGQDQVNEVRQKKEDDSKGDCDIEVAPARLHHRGGSQHP
jgi:ABC-type Na+ efflux pump permease subunit